MSCLAKAGKHLERHLNVIQNIVQGEFALQSGHRQTNNPISCCRHLVHLHFPLRSDEQYFVVRVYFLEFVGDGNGGEDMSSGTASADDNP